MPDEPPVALGLVGAGIMGRRMLDAIRSAPSCAVRTSAIWDPSPAALDRIAAGHPDLPRAADVEAVIAGCDVLYVASPPASHLGHGRAALAAGGRVFLEKPLAVDLGEARRFVAEAGDRGAVNFPFASSLAVATLRDWMPEMGRPVRLRIEVAFARWPRPWQADAAAWLDRPAEGGFTREVVSHFLFLSRRLLGPLADLRGLAAFPEPGRSERRIEAAFTAGGVPATLVGTVGETAADDRNTWTLEGDGGSIRLRDWAVAERLGPDGRFRPAPDAMSQEDARPVALRRQLDGVARLARGTPHHLATLEEALDVQECVEAILAG